MFRSMSPQTVKHSTIHISAYIFIQSIFVITVYVWRIIDYSKDYNSDIEIYYGVLIAYYFQITIHLTLGCLSILLLRFGIRQEKSDCIVPWVLGLVTTMAFEALSITYSNILRYHYNNKIDTFFWYEIGFYFIRFLPNILMISLVMQFHNLINNGFSWNNLDIMDL